MNSLDYLTHHDEPPISVPYVSDEKLEGLADFVREQSPQYGKLPVDIEKIIEFDFGVAIIPVQNLETNFHIQNYLTTDFKKIVIDKGQFEQYPTRVRFTLAHELGHILLHSGLFQRAKFNTLEELLKYHQLFDDKQYSRLEVQANFFASYLLFPTVPFEEIVNESISNAGGQDKFTFIHYEDLISNLTKTFNVSKSCAVTKLARSKPDLHSGLEDSGFPEDIADFFPSFL